MTFPSRVLAAGNSPLATGAICGGGTTGLVATGSTQATALQLTTTGNALTTGAAAGVKLPATEQGGEVWIRNDSGQNQTIYPFETSGTTFNAAASTITLATAKTIVLRALTNSYWISILTA